VFSDEFEAEGEALSAAAANPRWTAQHQWYGATQNIEVYLPEQVRGSCHGPGSAGGLEGSAAAAGRCCVQRAPRL
jgi:hypothetical protein